LIVHFFGLILVDMFVYCLHEELLGHCACQFTHCIFKINFF
jgi:hypothetical protein